MGRFIWRKVVLHFQEGFAFISLARLPSKRKQKIHWLAFTAGYALALHQLSSCQHFSGYLLGQGGSANGANVP